MGTAIFQLRPFGAGDGQPFAQVCQRKLADILAPEHPGAAVGKHHQPGDRVLQKLAPGDGGEICRELNRAARTAKRLHHPLRLRHVRQRQARLRPQPHGGIRLALGREPHHRRQHRRAVYPRLKLGFLLHAVLQGADHSVFIA